MTKSEYIVNSNGTAFHAETPDKVMRILERLRYAGYRVRLYYGDTETGRDWGETNDVTGTIGRSCGEYQVPLLIQRKDSLGGGAILTHCIVRIEYSTKADRERYGSLYKHPNYHKSE